MNVGISSRNFDFEKILFPASSYGPHWCLIGGGFLAVNYIQVHLQNLGNITFVFKEMSVESIQLVF